nr:glycosyltransferase [Ktedonobacteraceae bacterium]
VVICTKDRPVALRRCLLALLENQWLPSEVVVVDQGQFTTDPPVQAAFAEREIVLRHEAMQTSGVSRGRNLGITLSTADFIAFTDDDCVPDTGWLGALFKACTTGVDGASGRILPLPASDPDLVAVSSRTSPIARLYQGVSPHAPWDVGSGGNLLLRRAALKHVGGFDERLGPGAPGRAAEDIDLLYRLLIAGFTIAYEPGAVVYHEMKTRQARLRSRFPYGYGMGAFLATHISKDDGYARMLFRRYLRFHAGSFLGGLRHLDRWQMKETAWTCIGALWGAVSWRHAINTRTLSKEYPTSHKGNRE